MLFLGLFLVKLICPCDRRVQLRCSLTHAHSRAPVSSSVCMRMKTWSVPNVVFCYCEEDKEKSLSKHSAQLNLDGCFPLSSKSFFTQAPCFISKWTLGMHPRLANHSLHLHDQPLLWATRAGLLSFPVLNPLQPPKVDSAARFCLEAFALAVLSAWNGPFIAVTSTLKCHLLSKDFSKLSEAETFCLCSLLYPLYFKQCLAQKKALNI